jgi:CBS domain-containing protein
MRAADVMTTEVVTISPDASVLELAKLLSARGISGVPVVDADGRRRPPSGRIRRAARRRGEHPGGP